ncbi:putative manganese efflux pump MntP [bioreactor metagenome]|uniref:Putative manganese efflux pump MntP n=1 Tax=bioreactor metagenome TaxID=1076179 RepID=A0A644ZC05_9ZZZZ
MNVAWLVLLSFGLCFDTLAVSISIGINDRKVVFLKALEIAFILAVFQGLMPVLGWLGGLSLEKYIEPVDHWVALVLLSIVGGKMILESFGKEDKEPMNISNLRLIFTLAFATSIDAFAVGITLAFIDTNIWIASPVIGFFTGLTAMIGMLIGKKAAGFLGSKIQIIGGLILMGLGVKIVLEHQGIL